LESAKKEAKLTLDELNGLIVRELKKEGSIRFASLGIFRKRKLKARMGRNPATGESIKILVLQQEDPMDSWLDPR
jgi:DNA-binding protein HU-beta